MADRLAGFISVLFHPLWMPLLLFGVLVWTDPMVAYLMPRSMVWFVFPLLAINALAPAFSIWLMARGGYVSSVRLENRTERYWPISLVIMYYIMTYGLIRLTAPSVPWLLFSFILALIGNLVAALILSFFTKISLHMLAFGGCVGVVLALQSQHGLGPVMLPVVMLLLAGLTAWARLRLGAHRSGEVYLGFLVGALVSFLVVRSEWVV